MPRSRFGAAAYASELAQPLLIVTLTALVLVCAYVPSRRARPVAILALSRSAACPCWVHWRWRRSPALGGGFSDRLLVRLDSAGGGRRRAGQACSGPVEVQALGARGRRLRRLPRPSIRRPSRAPQSSRRCGSNRCGAGRGLRSSLATAPARQRRARPRPAGAGPGEPARWDPGPGSIPELRLPSQQLTRPPPT